MSTEKLEANHANAQLSTGPRTPDGKAASSLNSTTHGLSVNRISRKNPEAQARCEQRRKDYLAQYPHDAAADRTQADLIDLLATSRTRMELIEEAQDALPDETGPEYQTLQRYWRDAERSFTRSLRLLREHRSQPAADARRRTAEATRAQSQATLRGRLLLEVKRLEYDALTKEISTPETSKAAALASFRHRVHDQFFPAQSAASEALR